MALIFHCLTPRIVKFPVQRRCRSSIAGFYAFTVQKSTARSRASQPYPVSYATFPFWFYILKALLYVFPLYITCFYYLQGQGNL